MPLGSGGKSGTSANAVKAGEAFVEISARDRASAVIKRFGNRLRSLGGGLSKFGAGTTAVGLSVMTPMLASFKAAISYGDKFQKAADRMGSTSAAAQRLGYAAEAADSSLDAVVKTSMMIARSAIAADKGVTASAKAFELMGVTTSEFMRLGVDEQFIKIAETADTIPDQLDRIKFLLALTGTQAREMGSLFRGGASGIKQYFKEADQFLLSEDDTRDAAAVSDILSKFWRAIKITMLETGFALVGMKGEIGASVEKMVEWIQIAREWVRENRVLVVGIFAAGVALVVFGSVASGVGIAVIAIISIIGTLVTVIGTLVTAALSPLGLALLGIVVALVAVVVALRRYTGAWSFMAEITKELWGDMKQHTLTTLDGIKAAIEKGDINAAWEILTAGMRILWLDLQIYIQKQWNKTKAFLVDGLKDVQQYISEAFVGVQFLSEWGGTGFDSAKKEAIRLKHREVLLALRDENDIDLGNRKSFREKELADLIEEQQRAIDAQAAMIREAKKPVPWQVPLPPLPPKFGSQSMVDSLGAAVRGLMYGRNFSGALAIGPASDAARESLKVQEDMRDLLKDIRDKVHVPAFN